MSDKCLPSCDDAETVKLISDGDSSNNACETRSIDYGTITPTSNSAVTCRTESQVYKRRWYILLLFSAVNLSQNAVWNTWNPLAQSVQVAFNWGLFDIALLTNWGCITYVISMPFFSWMMDVKGLRWSVVSASGLVAAGSALRCITVEPIKAKWLIHSGHILNGFAGPVLMAAPSLLSAVWFPARQRTTATSLALLSSSIGISLSFILGPELVKLFSRSDCDFSNGTNTSLDFNTGWSHHHHHCNSSDEVMLTRHGIMMLMYFECAFSCLMFVVIIIYFPARPPSAPSITASINRRDFKSGVKQLFKHKTFWKIGLCYAVCVGVTDEWMSFIDPVAKEALTKCRSDSQYDQVETGWVGFSCSIVCGLGGCAVARLSDVFSRHMKLILSSFFSVSLLAAVAFTIDTGCYIPVNKVFIYTGYFVVSICIQSCIPLFYELSCENTYPIAEGVTGGLLTWLNNVVGVIFLLVLMFVQGTQWMNWTMVGSIAICLPIILLHSDSYNRLDLDAPSSRVLSINVDSRADSTSPQDVEPLIATSR